MSSKFTIQNSKTQFGLVSRMNHLLTAIIVFSLIGIGLYMHDIEDPVLKETFYDLHKSMGIALFGLMLVRLFWLKISPNPPQHSHNKLEHILAHSVKGTLYLTMLIMPILGWVVANSDGAEVSFFNLFSLPNIVSESESLHDITKEIHESIAFVILALIGLHIAGALKHHFVYKDNTLQRMFGKPKGED
ncbi:MAG TPA: cytochrome b [Thiomicrorhabdus sp.]|nr:cytochrome b [Thiomicrorhabdus sp.]